MIKVAIVDDHAPTREVLRELLEMESDFEIIYEASNGADAVPVISRGGIDVVTLDISMPGMSSIEVLRAIRKEVPDLRVLVLSGLPPDAYVFDMLRSGASGCIDKAAPPSEVITAIRALHAGKRYIAPALEQQLARAAVAARNA